MPFSPCVIIPIYNNQATIETVVEALAGFNLPCLIVDDGSDAPTKDVLLRLRERLPWVRVITRQKNGGKGSAMREGFHAAFGQGYTHAVQIDADGQHAVSDVPRFIAAAQRAPGSLIMGKPLFDESAPRARRYGRLVTQFWVAIETLSWDIPDALYGFRCYPLAPVVQLYREARIGDGMVFDTAIAVRLFWAGVPIEPVETRVTYLVGGLSHFHYLRDNLRITWLHTSLTIGMLLRLPRLLLRPLSRALARP
jgi:glycosyltransferase involved in cell wall biosynthesis